MVGGVYSITSPSGNMYIGSTIDFERRKGEHFRELKRNDHHSTALHNAFNKYGDNLEFKPLLICEPKDLLLYEQIYLDFYKPEYNICYVAGNTLGVKPSEKTREKLSKASKGRKHSEETKEKIALAHRGKKKTSEQIEKMRLSKLGQKYGPCSEERKQKISIANKARWAIKKNI